MKIIIYRVNQAHFFAGLLCKKEIIMNFKRIGILTSGGDAPGMNAAVRAVTRAALSRGVEVMGIYEGYQGLIDENMKLFSALDVSNILDEGGTILYSARCLEFKTEEGMQKAIESCRKNHIDGIVAVGGDGTFRGACDLTDRGIPCIGIPATIDNDITSTDESIGFDTAMNTVLEMVDRLRQTCESHSRCNVVEVMGREAGDIAVQSGIASGACVVTTKEFPLTKEEIIRRIVKCKKAGKRNFIVMVAEGCAVENPMYSEELTEYIQKETGIETRLARLAHVLRGGTPTLRDRVLASRMGEEAVELLLEGKSKLVVCLHGDTINPLDINFALTLDRMYKNKLKPNDLDNYSEEQIAEMRARCTRRSDRIRDLYRVSRSISV